MSVCVSVCVCVCVCVCLCVCPALDSSQTVELIIVKLGMVTASDHRQYISDTIMHHVSYFWTLGEIIQQSAEYVNSAAVSVDRNRAAYKLNCIGVSQEDLWSSGRISGLSHQRSGFESRVEPNLFFNQLLQHQHHRKYAT